MRAAPRTTMRRARCVPRPPRRRRTGRRPGTSGRSASSEPAAANPSAPLLAGNSGSRPLRGFDRCPQSPDRAIPPSWVTILHLVRTQFSRCTSRATRGISAPPNPLSPAATEEAACIAEDLVTGEWIGVGPPHDTSGLAAGGPTNHIARRGVPVHPRRAVGVLRDGGLLPIFLPRVGRRGDDHADTNDRGNQSN